jgi:hypothetical protein
MKEDIITKKKTVLSNIKLTQAPTAMEGPGNSKREPRRLQKKARTWWKDPTDLDELPTLNLDLMVM